MPMYGRSLRQSNRNAMKLEIGQHDGDWSEAKCNLQVSLLAFIRKRRERGRRMERERERGWRGERENI